MIKKFLQNIFKIFFYNFFLKIHGKIIGSIGINSDKRIEVKTLNIEKNFTYKVYKILGGRLYTDRIHDTAAILENKIIDGPSFQLRDNNNVHVNENIVFTKGTPRKLRNLNGNVLSLLTGGGGNDNYWHWLYDVLPRIELCERVTSLDKIDFFLLPNLSKKFQRETLKELNLPDHKLLSSEKYRHIKAKELIITNHPYVFTNNAHDDAQKVPEWIFKWLRKKFLKNLDTLGRNYPKKIYIDRSDYIKHAQFRSLINEDEIKNYLIKEGFTAVRLNDLNFTEQVKYFNNADFIIGLHGAGLANLSFCKNNTKVIEFKTMKTGKMYENVAYKNKLKYDFIASEVMSRDHTKQFGHIKIPLNILEKKLKI